MLHPKHSKSTSTSDISIGKSSINAIKLNVGGFVGNIDITNDTIVWSHQHSKEPTVLVSSSLAEGVDLKDDLSRFQIIIKLPFANLQDVRIKKKSKMGDWYLNNMFMKFVQQCGRSTRNIDDFSKTYVLDGSFWYWFHKAKEKGWFSGNFLRRIKK